MSLSKNPFGLFRQFFAVCCAHSLCAFGAQLPHLQPERCFRPRTRRGRKRFHFVFRLRGKFCEAFDSLKRGASVPLFAFGLQKKHGGSGAEEITRDNFQDRCYTDINESSSGGTMRPPGKEENHEKTGFLLECEIIFTDSLSEK